MTCVRPLGFSETLKVFASPHTGRSLREQRAQPAKARVPPIPDTGDPTNRIVARPSVPGRRSVPAHHHGLSRWQRSWASVPRVLHTSARRPAAAAGTPGRPRRAVAEPPTSARFLLYFGKRGAPLPTRSASFSVVFQSSDRDFREDRIDVRNIDSSSQSFPRNQGRA